MPEDSWEEKNKAYLDACLMEAQELLGKYVVELRGEEYSPPSGGLELVWGESKQPALDLVCGGFNLSEFERRLLLLCAGVELKSEVARNCAEAHGNPGMGYVTFGLAMAVFPGAHWSAITPLGPLRRFRLVEVSEVPFTPLVGQPLRIDERVLHYLVGVSYVDARIDGLMKSFELEGPRVESHERIVDDITASISGDEGRPPSVQLYGEDEFSKQYVASQVCRERDKDLWVLPGELVPSKVEEVEALSDLWCREAELMGSGLYVSADDVEPGMLSYLQLLLDKLNRLVFVGTRERQPFTGNSLSFRVGKPTRQEQFQLWKQCLSDNGLTVVDDELKELVSQFNLNASRIQDVVKLTLKKPLNPENLKDALWTGCLEVTRPRLSQLAQEIIPKPTMCELVLPGKAKQLLEEIKIHVAQRYQVYEERGFEKRSNRGLGISALFVGESGTGKTMAAEVLANDLNLALFRIDLSMVVSKYIGETEKNLRKVFDAAEEGGAILFFDEADALFGKRSEVKDSHDRYANIEVGYLLQRMESYRGLAILATNMKEALDQAFIRRIRFIVKFPFPDKNSRAQIWSKIFPKDTTDGLTCCEWIDLANLNITGGVIHNIALNASFLAAAEGKLVDMSHIKRAMISEYAKMERPLSRTELEGL